jgi:hypothetical protein
MQCFQINYDNPLYQINLPTTTNLQTSFMTCFFFDKLVVVQPWFTYVKDNSQCDECIQILDS